MCGRAAARANDRAAARAPSCAPPRAPACASLVDPLVDLCGAVLWVAPLTVHEVAQGVQGQRVERSRGGGRSGGGGGRGGDGRGGRCGGGRQVAADVEVGGEARELRATNCGGGVVW